MRERHGAAYARRAWGSPAALPPWAVDSRACSAETPRYPRPYPPSTRRGCNRSPHVRGQGQATRVTVRVHGIVEHDSSEGGEGELGAGATAGGVVTSRSMCPLTCALAPAFHASLGRLNPAIDPADQREVDKGRITKRARLGEHGLLHQARRLVEAHDQVHVLQGLARGALHEVVDHWEQAGDRHCATTAPARGSAVSGRRGAHRKG